MRLVVSGFSGELKRPLRPLGMLRDFDAVGFDRHDAFCRDHMMVQGIQDCGESSCVLSAVHRLPETSAWTKMVVLPTSFPFLEFLECYATICSTVKRLAQRNRYPLMESEMEYCRQETNRGFFASWELVIAKSGGKLRLIEYIANFILLLTLSYHFRGQGSGWKQGSNPQGVTCSWGWGPPQGTRIRPDLLPGCWLLAVASEYDWDMEQTSSHRYYIDGQLTNNA